MTNELLDQLARAFKASGLDPERVSFADFIAIRSGDVRRPVDLAATARKRVASLGTRVEVRGRNPVRVLRVVPLDSRMPIERRFAALVERMRHWRREWAVAR